MPSIVNAGAVGESRRLRRSGIESLSSPIRFDGNRRLPAVSLDVDRAVLRVSAQHQDASHFRRLREMEYLRRWMGHADSHRVAIDKHQVSFNWGQS